MALCATAARVRRSPSRRKAGASSGLLSVSPPSSKRCEQTRLPYAPESKQGLECCWLTGQRVDWTTRAMTVSVGAGSLVLSAAAAVAITAGPGWAGESPADGAAEAATPAVGAAIPPVVRGGRVVARGSSPVGGRWRLEAYRRRGLPCIRLTLLAPPAGTTGGAAGQCGHFPRAPGFGYSALQVSDRRGRAEHLIFGRAPRRAAFVRMTAPGGLRRVVRTRPGPRGTRSDFWLIVAPPVHGEATLRWRAADRSTAGKPLHVPATRQ